MTRPMPEKHMHTQCGQMLGGGIMSYRCYLPMGHDEKPADDPEPCYAAEARGSVVLWEAWYERQQAKAAQAESPAEVEPDPDQIVCPDCGEGIVTIDETRGVGVCDTCSAVLPMAIEPGGKPTKTREGDQPLPVANEHRDIQSRVIEDIAARREVGISRYGTALQPHNGRDAMLDLYEELLDACMYAKQVMVERDQP